MKKFLLGTVGLMALGLAAPAVAADLPARAYTKAPPMIAAIYDWSGFYIGANGGGAWNKDTVDFGGLDRSSHTATGAVAGGQVGYRWQAANWVFGLEAQGDWADVSGNHFTLATGYTDYSKLKAFGLFTGQVGYAWNNALLYVKGGAAVTSTKFRYSGPTIASTNDVTKWGGSIGVGLEYGFAPNWSVGVEYDHLFISRGTQSFYNAVGAVDGVGRVGGDTDLVTARLNYRWGGPIVAKY